MANAGDAKSVGDERAKLGRDRTRRAVVWRTLLSDVDGRKFCWWLLAQGNMFSSTFRGEDTHASAFAEGTRALMIPIQGEMIRAAPADYLKMTIEHASREAAEQLEEENGRDTDTES